MISYRQADIFDRINKPVTISFNFRAQGHSGLEDDIVYEGSKIDPEADHGERIKVINMLNAVSQPLIDQGEWFGNYRRFHIKIFDLIRQLTEIAKKQDGYAGGTIERNPSARYTVLKIRVKP